MGETKEKKKPTKVVTPEKRILDTIQNIFMKPDMRRSAFLYCGFHDVPENCYVLGSDPKEMEYGNPKQSLYMIHVKDPQMQEDVKCFLQRFLIDPTVSEIISLAALVSIAQKHKLDETVSTYRNDEHQLLVTAPSLADDRILTKDYDSLFILNQFAATARGYLDTLFHKNTSFEYPIDNNDPKETLFYVVLSHDQFADSSIGDIFNSELRVLLARGIDWLIPKSLIKDTDMTFTGLRFWQYSGSTLRYAYCLDSDKVDILGARCNVLLLPER